jgi:serine/threonine-protein kinase RsbW
VTAADGAVELRVDGTAEPAWLDDVHGALARLWSAAPDVPELDRLRFETAVIEIATNIVRHTVPGAATPGSTTPAVIRATAVLRAVPGLVEAVLSDDGAEVEVDLDPAPVDDLAESGRGIALVQRAVDTLELRRVDDRNTWRLTRVLPG